MKLNVRLTDEDLKKVKNINLYLPNGFINTKIFWQMILKYVDKENKDKVITTRKTVSKFYKVIRKYIKENGHFTLIEVVSEDAFIEVIL